MKKGIIHKLRVFVISMIIFLIALLVLFTIQERQGKSIILMEMDKDATNKMNFIITDNSCGKKCIDLVKLSRYDDNEFLENSRIMLYYKTGVTKSEFLITDQSPSFYKHKKVLTEPVNVLINGARDVGIIQIEEFR